MKKYKVMQPNVKIKGQTVEIGEVVELAESTATLFKSSLSEVKRKPGKKVAEDS